DRPPAVEPHDELLDLAGQSGVALGRAGAAQLLDHHRDHDLRPAFADQRQRAVEVEQGEAKAAPGEVATKNFDVVHEQSSAGTAVIVRTAPTVARENGGKT